MTLLNLYKYTFLFSLLLTVSPVFAQYEFKQSSNQASQPKALGLISSFVQLSNNPAFVSYVRQKVYDANKNYVNVQKNKEQKIQELVKQNIFKSINSSNSMSTLNNTKALSQEESAGLSRYDISILVDSSGSMNEKDCPSLKNANELISRWQWCQEQMNLLTLQTSQILPKGVNLVSFSQKAHNYGLVSAEQIIQIFNAEEPKGATNLAKVLDEEIKRYFLERDKGINKRPKIITIITDGLPADRSSVRKIIKNASERVQTPSELKIVFYLIGNDNSGKKFIDELDNQIDSKLDIVSTNEFQKLTELGLARSLAKASMN